MSRPQLPELPLELWIAIVSHLTVTPDDLCWLWLNLKRVSRTFSAVIETAVSNYVLRTAEIAFPFHRTKVIRSDHPPMVMRIQLGTIVTRFDRLSEDGERAFFRDKDALGRLGPELLAHSVSSWRNRVEMYLADASADLNCEDMPGPGAHVMLQQFQFNQPPHVITMGDMVNDTELLDLQVDFDRLELSFNWKHMVSNFLGEEERVKCLESMAKVSTFGMMDVMNVRLTSDPKLSQHSRLVDMRLRLHSGRLDLDDALLTGVDMTRMQEQIRRKVRCHRFRHEYQRTGRPISLSRSLGHPGRVEEHLRLAYMRNIRDTLPRGRKSKWRETESTFARSTFRSGR
jgi:hypothetical protein